MLWVIQRRHVRGEIEPTKYTVFVKNQVIGVNPNRYCSFRLIFSEIALRGNNFCAYGANIAYFIVATVQFIVAESAIVLNMRPRCNYFRSREWTLFKCSYVL